MGVMDEYSPITKMPPSSIFVLFALAFFPSLEVESQYDAQGDLNRLGARGLLSHPFDCLE